MRIDHVTLSEIEFQYVAYSQALYDSLKRAGLNFPIRVSYHNNAYHCTDGNKRLSAIQDILRKTSDRTKFKRIPIIVEQNARTAAPYSMHNHH